MTLFQGNRALLDDFRDGEEAALRSVYSHYVKKVELFVSNGWYDPQHKSRVFGISDFEVQTELIQEVFLRAFSRKGRLAYDGLRPYRIYLLSITRNVIVDYIRKKPRDALSHVSVELDNPDFDFEKTLAGEQEVQNEADLDWQRCLNATHTFVKSLDNDQQRFMALRFQQELPLLEVARQLSISRGKARHMEKSLGRRLKKYLQTMKLSLNWRD